MEKSPSVAGYTISEKLGESIYAEVFKVYKPGGRHLPLVLKRIKQGATYREIISTA